MAKTIAMVAKTVKHLYSFLLFFCVLNLCRLFWLAFLSRTFLNMVTYAQMMKVFIAAKIVSRQKMLNEVSKTNPMGFLPNLKENQPIGADDSQAPVIAKNTVFFLITWYLRGRKMPCTSQRLSGKCDKRLQWRRNCVRLPWHKES